MSSSSTLNPPNDHILTDQVAGHVLQRSVLPHHSFVGDIICRREEEPRKYTNTRSKKRRLSAAKPRVSNKRTRSARVKRVLPLYDEEQPDSQDDAVAGDSAAYHRERRRRNQERYRMRQRKLKDDLEEINQKLRGEIERLDRQRKTLSYGVSTKETMWSIAAEYFRVFKRGLVAPEGVRKVELDFLRVTMAPDLDAGIVRGFEALTRNWKVFTQCFKDIDVRLGRLDQIGENSLVATTTTSVTITSNTLRYMFPHLARDITDRHKRSRLAHITDKLLGYCLVMRGTVRFDWDNAHSHVVALITQADMVSPVLELLGNIEYVSLVFSNALITPECNLVIGDYLNQHWRLNIWVGKECSNKW